VDAGIDGDLQLGADAVIGGYQHRVAEARGLEVEQSAEATDLAIGAGASRRPHQRLDLLDHGVAGIDVDACLGIGEAVPALAHLFPLRGANFLPGSSHEVPDTATECRVSRPGRRAKTVDRGRRRSGTLRVAVLSIM
jgi:hypothetical protein